MADLNPLAGDAFLRPFRGAPTAVGLDSSPSLRRLSRDGRRVGATFPPSAAIADEYRRRIERLVDEMSRSAIYWISAAYRADDERIMELAGFAADAHPSTEFQKLVARLKRRWVGKFDESAPKLAKYFATAIHKRSKDDLRRILRESGISVPFSVSNPIRSVLRAVVDENVSLIRSIPEQYLTQVEGEVMRSVVAGRDLKTLTDSLRHQHGVTRRRAELIARDQNNKATGAIQRLQYMELGITKAIWRHSHAGRDPRPTHVANDGNEYDVRKGWYDPHEKRYIRPGELINCRCFSQPILPGM